MNITLVAAVRQDVSVVKLIVVGNNGLLSLSQSFL
jgi:hypothetical protein